MTDKITPKNKACLICIDGWGISDNPDSKGDAIRNANTPVMSGFSKLYPHSVTSVEAHGLFVGLPEGLMGNSEVGHLNIGAGRIVYQDIVRIDLSIKENTLAKQPNLVKALEAGKKAGRIQFLGLISDGGVHSHINHLKAFLKAAKDFGIPKAFVHFFGDGRDTAPKSSNLYAQQLVDFMKEINYGQIATITGRYYAMDRDKRWERLQIAYDGMVGGKGHLECSDPVKGIEQEYAEGLTDEFLKPIIVDKEGLIKDGDSLIFFNYRSDRMRQLVQVFGIPPRPFNSEFDAKNLTLTTMTQYNASFPFPIIFPPQKMDDVLAEWLSKHGIPQCHIAETEKFAHVTFFFNGGVEKAYPGEDRDLIPSPKVATYDLKPEMSAIEVAEKTAERLGENKYPFICINFAPCDMVGHTGIYEAAIKGVEATDKAIGIVFEACKKNGYVLFITADHGNAEKMIDETTGAPHTAHTKAKVPFIMTSNDFQFDPSMHGSLCDVAPTILDVMGIPQPEDMTGTSMIKH